MSLYTDICRDNQYLYGLLEQLSYEIAYCTLHKHVEQAETLEEQKRGVKSLININLEKMEEIWKAEASRWRTPNRKNRFREPSLSELRVILSYQRNPDQGLQVLADKYKIGHNTVSNIITKLINKEYEDINGHIYPVS